MPNLHVSRVILHFFQPIHIHSIPQMCKPPLLVTSSYSCSAQDVLAVFGLGPDIFLSTSNTAPSPGVRGTELGVVVVVFFSGGVDGVIKIALVKSVECSCSVNL